MRTCESHDDAVVVYDTKFCPLCEAEKKIEGLEDDVQDLQERVDEFESEKENG